MITSPAEQGDLRMSCRFTAARVGAIALVTIVAACGRAPAPQPATPTATATATATTTDAPVVNVFNWADYIAPGLLAEFTRETGIRVNYDTFDSNEVLETKLLAGRSGYDVVVITATFMENQIKAGVYQPLDPARLPNRRNLDPALAATLAPAGTEGRYSVPYHWGTTVVGYDARRILERLPGAPLDSLALALDPAIVARFADCGFAVVDSPVDVLGVVLLWLGRDPNSERPEDLAAAADALMAIRPYVRYVNGAPIQADLANGEICIAIGFSGDLRRARRRSLEAGRGPDIRIPAPREGAVVFSDGLAILADAPHPDNAHRLIDFLLRADVAARLSEYLQYPNANAASWPLIAPAIRNDPTIYPPAAAQARLVADRVESAAFRRQLMRAWTRFRTGR
jgi:putrescine transport system substrate-binding protein